MIEVVQHKSLAGLSFADLAVCIWEKHQIKPHDPCWLATLVYMIMHCTTTSRKIPYSPLKMRYWGLLSFSLGRKFVLLTRVWGTLYHFWGLNRQIWNLPSFK